MFTKSRWYSSRIGCEATLARWGTTGQPVLVFPTAGGDAEEIERFHLIKVLGPLLEAGKIKIYSADSVGGRVWFKKEGSPEHRMYIQHQYHQYIKHEVVPAIRKDCNSEDILIWTAGASIGAFHAAATVCRFPDIFSRALAMSGTFDLMRFCEATETTEYYRVSSPLQFVPHLAGKHLDLLRTRFIQFATGEGKWENIGESFRLAQVLGDKGIPNHVASWGKDVDHDWVTWRAMMPKYLGEWTA
ncbi:MAG: alpha/beta hydrolase-fold protein [Polyangiaceae bacterium]